MLLCAGLATVGGVVARSAAVREPRRENTRHVVFPSVDAMSLSVEQPQPHLATLVGQELIKQSLRVRIDTAQQQGHPLPHMLLCGLPEMGKATFANAVANEMGVSIRSFSGDSIPKAGDLVAFLTNLRTGELLLVEHVELTKKSLLDILVEVITDFSVEISLGKGPSSHNVNLKLPVFTLIGTTSNLKKVDRRLLHLMILYELASYNVDQMSQIMLLLASKQGIALDSETASLLAEYSEGCPGNASILLRRVHDYATAFATGQMTSAIVRDALVSLGYESRLPNSVGVTEGLHSERQPIPDDVKIFVWRRDGGQCVKCGSQEKLEYDHIIPISKGGSNTARNLQLLCEKCNRLKGANIA